MSSRVKFPQGNGGLTLVSGSAASAGGEGIGGRVFTATNVAVRGGAPGTPGTASRRNAGAPARAFSCARPSTEACSTWVAIILSPMTSAGRKKPPAWMGAFAPGLWPSMTQTREPGDLGGGTVLGAGVAAGGRAGRDNCGGGSGSGGAGAASATAGGATTAVARSPGAGTSSG